MIAALVSMLIQPPETAQPPIQPILPPFSSPFEIRQPARLALTPTFDGKLELEEWDALSDSSELSSYLQWAPGELYLAVRAPVGKAVVVSLDMNGDGWLKGSDNLELKIADVAGNPDTQSRLLDCSDRNGPAWRSASFVTEGLQIASSTDAANRLLEMRIVGAGLREIGAGAQIGVRVDAVDPSAPEPERFVPRLLSLVTLQLNRAIDLPAGLKWNSELRESSVTPGERIRIRTNTTNNGGPILKRYEMRTWGASQRETSSTTGVFPVADRKNRAFVDYETLVAPSAIPGFRVLEARLIREDGTPVVLQTSYLVSDLVTFEASFPKNLRSQPNNQIVRGSLLVKSQTSKRVSGELFIQAPKEWVVATGSGKKFSIYFSRGSWRNRVELIAPANAKGLVPLKVQARIGSRTIEQTLYIYLG